MIIIIIRLLLRGNQMIQARKHYLSCITNITTNLSLCLLLLQ